MPRVWVANSPMAAVMEAGLGVDAARAAAAQARAEGVTGIRDVGSPGSATRKLLPDDGGELVACGRFLAPEGRYFRSLYAPVSATELVSAALADIAAGARWASQPIWSRSMMTRATIPRSWPARPRYWCGQSGALIGQPRGGPCCSQVVGEGPPADIQSGQLKAEYLRLAAPQRLGKAARSQSGPGRCGPASGP